jgi:excinuclease UvrABC nuclease subunit
MFSDVYGPYPNGNQLKEALKIIRKIFPFYDDKSKNYKEFYRQIELAPNTEKREEYVRNIRNIKLFPLRQEKQNYHRLKKRNENSS